MTIGVASMLIFSSFLNRSNGILSQMMSAYSSNGLTLEKYNKSTDLRLSKNLFFLSILSLVDALQ